MGEQASIDITEALSELFGALALASITYQDSRSRQDHGRTAAHAAVLGMVAFVDRLWPNERLAAPLHALNAALIDIAQGIRSPMLTPSSSGRRTRDPNAVNILKLYGAFIMQLQMDAGLSKNDAAEKTSNLLHSAGYRQYSGNKKPITANTVSNWRDHHIGAVTGEYAGSFKSMVEQTRGLGPITPHVADKYAKHLLRDRGPKI